MPTREFHFVEGKSAKFWRVEQKGARQVVTYGRMGTAGVSKTKEFPDAAAARASTEKLITEKLLKGYVEAGKAAPRRPAAKKAAGTRAAMDKAWERAERTLRKQGLLEQLPKGASATAIKRVERALGIALPEDFRASYARHDGGGERYILEGREFLSLDRIVSEWKIWKELLDDGTFNGTSSRPENPRTIKADWWNPKWIPFTYDGAGNHHCIDLDPASGGTYGQVITMWHDDDTREVVTRSFAEFIAKARWGGEEL